MKVSVIIPTYNRGQYICQAIDSALNQTMKDIEVIVVDDGSTDNTKEMISTYQGKIHYVYTENGGSGHARNVGMEMARGEYVSFLDSDDLYYPYKTELQADFLDRFQDIDMVYSDFTAFNDSGFSEDYYLKKYHSPAYKDGLNYQDIFSTQITFEDAELNPNHGLQRKIYTGNIFETYFHAIVVFTNSMMFRRGILGKIGMQDERFLILQDMEFALRICKHYKVAFMDIITYKLRYHEGQISEPQKDNYMKVIIDKQKEIIEIAEKRGINDKEYYSENRDRVNKRLAVLHKSVAIPMMGKGNYPVSARYHLDQCAYFGHPETILRLITYLPYIGRRIILKMISILKLA